jgi:hypothetical protein
MINENLEKLVQHARDKKPTDFKEILTSEIDSRIATRVTEIRDGLSKNMFKITENCEGHPDGVEHTHEDGTVHTHPGGDKEHTHDEEVEEGTLPPALQKAIDAKKKKGGDDEEDKEKDEGTLPPALQKAIDAKKKGKGDDDEDDTKKEEKDEDEEDEDDSPVGKKDENIANFGDKKAKPFTDDDNPTDNKKKKDKKEDIRTASRRILDKSK